MYAVVQTGGKQYKVAEGQKIAVEKLDGKVGSKLTLDQVLAIGGKGDLQIGQPLVAGATVEVEVTEQDRADKIIVFKKKRRHGYHKKQGHRQSYTMLKINKIVV